MSHTSMKHEKSYSSNNPPSSGDGLGANKTDLNGNKFTSEMENGIPHSSKEEKRALASDSSLSPTTLKRKKKRRRLLEQAKRAEQLNQEVNGSSSSLSSMYNNDNTHQSSILLSKTPTSSKLSGSKVIAESSPSSSLSSHSRKLISPRSSVAEVVEPISKPSQSMVVADDIHSSNPSPTHSTQSKNLPITPTDEHLDDKPKVEEKTALVVSSSTILESNETEDMCKDNLNQESKVKYENEKNNTPSPASRPRHNIEQSNHNEKSEADSLKLRRWRAHQITEDYVSLAGSIMYPNIRFSNFGYDPLQNRYPMEHPTTIGLLTHPMRRPLVIEKWSPHEIAMFEAALCIHGKQFHIVQKIVGSKNTQEIVEFYYVWKKTKHYKVWKRQFEEDGASSDDDDDDDDDAEDDEKDNTSTKGSSGGRGAGRGKNK